jgi:cell division septation protein DedD
MGESQRLLWVIVSVALLVVVVLAGGLYWLRPAAADEQVAAAGVPAFDPYEFVRGDQPAPGLLPAAESAQDAQETDPGVVADESAQQVTGLALGVGQRPSIETSIARNGDAVVIARNNVGTLPGTAMDTPAARDRANTELRAIGAVAMLPASPAPFGAPTVPPVDARAQFWIQVASFASRGRADSVDHELHSRGVASRITTRTSGDQLFYRVRVGPYENEQEAAKFLTWVRSLEGLESSYISRVY